MTEVLGVDFDLYADELNGPQYWDLLDPLRRQGALVWVNNHGGYWAATSHDLVREIAQDWETFSSAEGVALQRVTPEQMPWLMPVEFDPPRQSAYRKAVLPHLTPKAMSVLEDGMREVADELIDEFVEAGRCDFAVEFARKYPGTVFFRLIAGASSEDIERLEPAARDVSFASDPAKRGEGARALRSWVTDLFASRASSAVHDVVGAVMSLRHPASDLTEEEVLSGMEILALGGIGTSADLIAAIVCILSDHMDLQERVRNDLGLVPALVEEVLRLEPSLTVAFRTATRDVVINGCEIRKGQRVGLFFGLANRDPAWFDHPEEVDIDRARCPHLTFNAGVHRCLGSNLARLQVKVAVEQLLTRLSPFRIPPGAKVEYLTRQERGPSSVPLEFTPGARRAG
jgi:cytochrome P450